MAKIFITATHGPEDPTRATLPFFIAKGAKEAGHEVSVALALDSPLLLKDGVRSNIVGVGTPPLEELFRFALDSGVTFYV